MNKKMLRKKLALMLVNLKKKRPFYTEIEYLENTDKQYIDTGYYPNNNTKVEFMASGISADSFSASSTGTWFFGGRQAYLQSMYGSYYVPNTQQLTYNFGVNVNTTSVASSLVYGDKRKFYFDSTGLYIDDVKRITPAAQSAFTSPATLILFALNNNGTVLSSTKYKMHYCKIWDGNTLVRDMIPVLDWDMTPCMYDKVTEQLFYNKGTGDFTAGREIHYVEYLERPVDAGTGSSMWINTGLKYFADFEVGVSLRESVSNTCLGTSSAERLERNSATYPQWKFTSAAEGAYASNISIIGYHELKWKDGKIYADGVQLATKAKTSTASTYPMVLFGIPTSETTANAYHNIIYFCKLWNPTDGTLVRDYIPAIDENGVGFMFDAVTHTIYDNAGTGAFAYPAREVEYLQSDGARAILAGVTVDDTCGYDVKWMALNADDRIILGTKGSGDSRWVLSGSNNPNVNISWNTSSGGIGLGLNKIQTAQMNYLNDRKRILNDTPLADITATLSSAASTYNVGIFGGYWGATTISLYSTCRIYYAKITKGTELIRDFIPMVKDGSPCLFDKIGGLYYFGTGTGSFTTGKIAEPEYE